MVFIQRTCLIYCSENSFRFFSYSCFSASFAGRTAYFPQSGHWSVSSVRLKMKPQLSQVNINSITAPIITGAACFYKGVISIEHTYPALDRTAFLIEHACVPRAYPTFCAETAQLLAMMEAAQRQNTPQEPNGR